MKKLFGLFPLALAFLPSQAFAVTCFWVGGTANWDGTNTGGGGAGGIKWANASGGGTTCAGGGTGGSPSTGDAATFDASSGGGTATITTTVAITDLNMSAFTGTINGNGNNVTLSGGSGAFTRTGSATNSLTLGSGTWTISGNSGAWNANGSTNFTLTSTGSTIAFTATGAGARTFNGGTSQTYNIVSVAGNSANNAVAIAFSTALTITTLSVSAPNRILFPNNQTTTVTTFSNISGSSSNQVLLSSNAINGNANVATVSSANNFTCDWCGVSNLTFSGGGTFAATNSLNMIGNTNIAITPPSGGAATPRTIGG